MHQVQVIKDNLEFKYFHLFYNLSIATKPLRISWDPCLKEAQITTLLQLLALNLVAKVHNIRD